MDTSSPALVITSFDMAHLPDALAIVGKANRRAARAGLDAPLEVVYSSALVVDGEDTLGLPRPAHEVVTFVVLGEPLKVEGWEFVATLSFDAEAGVITRPVPGATVVDLSAYRGLKAPVCDQCKTARQRKDVYVLRAADGETKVIGSKCLAAFIGIDPSGALRFLGESFSEKLDGELYFAGGGEWRFPAQTVLALASAAIAAYGWVPKSAYEGTPTVGRVSDVLFPLPSHEKPRRAALEVRATLAAKLDEAGGPSRAQERADEVLAWVRGGGVGSSEYAMNLQAILSAETVSERNLGLAVSAVSAWAKAQDKALEQAKRAERAATSEWVGKEKERLVLSLELVQQPRFIDGDFGVKTLLVFADEAGNVFKWWATGSHDYAVGSKWAGKATVKKHEEYNGAKSTVITRASLEQV
jgi:hypothetical protein